ncbi:MAG: thiamine diphosphokinase [Prevotella sp.]|nr:thiamine diphosphokinase [Prevotella sp.]
MEKTYDAVIIANGTFPTHAVPRSILEHAPLVVACDGAIANLLPLTSHHSPPIVIGDGDSIPAEYRNRLIRIDEQDDNDLTKATRYCLRQGWRKIAYLGCTGKREDHTLGNISLLMRYFRDFGVEGTMFTDHGYFTPAHGDRTFNAQPGQQVSIFNFGCQHIDSEGLKWHSYAYREWWQGTLNEALATHFTLRADSYYLVYQTYELK